MAAVDRAANAYRDLRDLLRSVGATATARVLLATALFADAIAEFVHARDSLSRAATIGPGAQVADVAPLDYRVVLIIVALALLIALPPLFIPRPLTAAIATTLANLAGLAFFHTVPVAGIAAQLLVHYRLGRAGRPLPGLLLAVPWLPLAFVDTSDVGFRVHAVLLAGLAPAVALAGHARWADALARERLSTEQAFAGSQLENLARGERARIARELHDVVAHHISMISVQAETARLTTPGLPEEGAKRFLALGDAARAALTEMRRLLGVLREDAEPADGAGQARVERRPQPDLSLDHLVELLDQAREAGGGMVRLIVRGAPAGLDPSRELAAYRIIQESLTNARRHAPGAAVDVELCRTDRELVVRVRDNGPGSADVATGGHGLLGMRERAAAAGARLSIGSPASGGFVIEAAFPFSEEEP